MKGDREEETVHAHYTKRHKGEPAVLCRFV